MPKLHQLIAVLHGKKSQAQSVLTRVHHMIQKSELLSGISRQYKPRDEDGERLPPESKQVQFTVPQAIAEASATLTELLDAVASQDITNCAATADIVVDGTALIHSVPVTHLLFLEKQLVDLHTFVDKLPTLDPAERWTYDAATGVYRTEVTETTRTKKIPKAFVKYEATKEHPAQVEMFHEDLLVGTWATTKFSGAIPADDKRDMLERVRKLQEAVKMAREGANSLDVIDLKTGKPLLSYVFQA